MGSWDYFTPINGVTVFHLTYYSKLSWFITYLSRANNPFTGTMDIPVHIELVSPFALHSNTVHPEHIISACGATRYMMV